MKLSLADRRAMIKAVGEEWEWTASGGNAAAKIIQAQLVTERYDVHGDGGKIITTTTRRLHVVAEDCAAAVGDRFTRNDQTWKVGGDPIDEDTGFLELDLKKVS